MTLFKLNWHLSRYDFMQIIPQCGGVSAPGSLGGGRAAAGYPGAFNSRRYVRHEAFRRRYVRS